MNTDPKEENKMYRRDACDRYRQTKPCDSCDSCDSVGRRKFTQSLDPIEHRAEIKN